MLILTFSTSDLLIFYLGFEGLSLPVFFLIFLYGAEITKIRASIYFIIYSLVSSTFMAISIFIFYSQFGTTNINNLKTKFLYSSSSLVPVYFNSCSETLYTSSLNYTSLLTFERLSVLWILLFLSFPPLSDQNPIAGYP